MKTKNLIAMAGIFYVLAMVLGIFISWKYCGRVLVCVSGFCMLLAIWNETKDLLKN